MHGEVALGQFAVALRNMEDLVASLYAPVDVACAKQAARAMVGATEVALEELRFLGHGCTLDDTRARLDRLIAAAEAVEST